MTGVENERVTVVESTRSHGHVRLPRAIGNYLIPTSPEAEGGLRGTLMSLFLYGNNPPSTCPIYFVL